MPYILYKFTERLAGYMCQAHNCLSETLLCLNLSMHACIHACSVASVMSDSLWPMNCIACRAPLSMGFPRQEYWSGLPLPPPGYLPDPGISELIEEAKCNCLLPAGSHRVEKPLFSGQWDTIKPHSAQDEISIWEQSDFFHSNKASESPECYWPESCIVLPGWPQSSPWMIKSARSMGDIQIFKLNCSICIERIKIYLHV